MCSCGSSRVYKAPAGSGEMTDIIIGWTCTDRLLQTDHNLPATDGRFGLARKLEEVEW